MTRGIMVYIAVFVGCMLSASGDEPQPVTFGINSFLGNLGHSEIRGPLIKPLPEDRTHYLDAVQELGVRVIRETFMNWADIEPERGGGYRLEPYDDIARKASDRGIEIVGLMYPMPTWATGEEPTPPDQLMTSMWQLPKRDYEPDFRRFVSAMVKRYCGRYDDSIRLRIPIRKWIFSNELDIFSANPGDYAFWLRAFSEEVKGADPSAHVVMMGFANLWSGAEFLRSVLNSDALRGPGFPYFDVLTFHCYTSLNAPNIYSMDVFMGYLRKTLDDYDLDMPIWLDETGDASEDLQKQAVEDVKLVMHAASCGVSQVNLHGLWDIGDDNHWGVLESSPSGQVPVRKPSFTAYQTLVRMIGANRGIEFLGPGRYRAVLDGGHAVYVLWTEGAHRTIADVVCGASRIRATTLGGESRECAVADLAPSAVPLFVEVLE